MAGQILSVVTLAMVNPKLHSNPFITKRQLNPSRFGNNKYKLIVLPLFVAEAASHSQRLHKTAAIVRFAFTSGN